MFCVIFDFDGPIMNSRLLAQSAISTAWRELSLDGGCPTIADITLLNTTKLLDMVLIKENISLESATKEKLIHTYKKHLKLLEQRYSIDENIRSALVFLKKNPNICTALISNRRLNDLEEILVSCGIRGLFDYIYGRDSFLPKPDTQALEDLLRRTGIDRGNVFYIGDQDVDFEFAKRGKILYYHAGYSTEPCNVAIKEAKCVFRSTKDLHDALTNIIEESSTNFHLYTDSICLVNSDRLCLFVGSGISVPSGIGDWNNAYGTIFSEIGIAHLYNSNNLTTTLQLLSLDDRFNHKIFDRFRYYFSPSNSFEPNKYHFIILNMRLKRIWTTNYDHLFEQIIFKHHRDTCIIKNDTDLKNNYNKHMLVKMNGDFEDATYAEGADWNIVFFNEHFNLFNYHRPLISRLFEEDFMSSVMIFVGISFNDPNLNRIISVIKHRGLKPPHKHFYLTTISKGIHQSYLQKLKEQELKHYGITTLFFNTHDEILQFLQDLYICRNKQCIGISGSIPYPSSDNLLYNNSLFTVQETHEICRKLGELFASKGFYTASGGAPYVGIPFVEGAYSVDSDKTTFYLRAFGGKHYKHNVPAQIINSQNISDMRKAFILSLNCLIVVSGRYSDCEKGVVEEIEIAMHNRIPIFIISQFGGQGAEYYNRFINEIPLYYLPTMSSELISLNKKIFSMNKEDLVTYLFSEFIEDIKAVIILKASHDIV